MTSLSKHQHVRRTWCVTYKLTLFPWTQFSRWFYRLDQAESFVRKTNYLSSALIERRL